MVRKWLSRAAPLFNVQANTLADDVARPPWQSDTQPATAALRKTSLYPGVVTA